MSQTFSPTSSTTSSLGSLPSSRIQCSGQQIVVGGTKYASASDALMAYLQQFSDLPSHSAHSGDHPGLGSPSKLLLSRDLSGSLNGSISGSSTPTASVAGSEGTQGEVEELLTSKASPQLQLEVTDTLREVKLRRLLKQAALKSQNQTKTGLQQEVEAALNRSAQLLERVTQEASVSETSSVLTDPSSLDTDLQPSRRRPRSSLSSSLCAPVSYRPPRQSRDRIRRSSSDNLFPSSQHFSSGLQRSSSSSSASLSNQSDPTDVLRRIRSRSVSPGQHRRFAPPSWVEKLDQSVQESVPRWVGEVAGSETLDWGPPSSRSVHGTKVPSWVGEVETTSSVNTGLEHLLNLPTHGRYSDTASDLRPALNYTDLMSSLPHTPVKQVTFTDHTDTRQPKHSTPLHNGHVSVTQDFLPKPSKVMDSEFNGEAFLRNNILPQTARLKKSIDNFVTSSENLGRKSASSNSSDADSDNRCSSLDTQALLSGKPLTRADITGASTIPKDSQMASKNFSTSPTISAVGEAGSPTSNGHGSSDCLEGDRSWEKLTNTFKPPVPVEMREDGPVNGDTAKGLNGTLSGGKQPGSMEALKNMLFKLQAEEHNVPLNGTESPVESPVAMATIPALEGYDFSGEPGGHSLEKALVHLNRLKNLVKTTGVEDSSPHRGLVVEGASAS